MDAYNVGDSFTYAGAWCPNEQDHFWYRIAQDLGCVNIINDSEPGASNDSIIKRVMRHCLENPRADTLYLINITTIYRFDITDTGSDKFHDVLKPAAIADLAFERVECTLYAELIGMIELLKARNKKFLVFNNFENFTDAPLPMRDAFVRYIKQEPGVMNWFANARGNFHQAVSQIKPWDYDSKGWVGHDGPQGHLAYYKMLASSLVSKSPWHDPA
jgi:hypothetical protein